MERGRRAEVIWTYQCLLANNKSSAKDGFKVPVQLLIALVARYIQYVSEVGKRGNLESHPGSTSHLVWNHRGKQ